VTGTPVASAMIAAPKAAFALSFAENAPCP
jgi:hypothetical protein